MAFLEDLDIERINEVLEGAVEKHVPLTVTARYGTRWVSLHSRFVAFHSDHLWVEMPTRDGEGAVQFEAAQKIGVNFKLKHHKHVFNATVVGPKTVHLDGEEVPVLVLCAPARMQRLQ